MQLIDTEGDIIQMAEAGVIDFLFHGCNCVHAMGSGIAGQLARKYPKVPEVDRTTPYGDRAKLGTWTLVQLPRTDGHFFVVNAYTQYMPSYDQTDVFEYAAFEQLCAKWRAIVNLAAGDGLVRIGFPHIGAGLAGGDWERIKQIIIDAFQEVENCKVFLVEYNPAITHRLADLD